MAVPSSNSPVLTEQGFFSSYWYRWFSDLVGPPSPITNITGPSPLTFTAAQKGQVLISGGTVSLLQFNRGRTTVAFPNNGIVLMSAGDTLTVTYSGSPTIDFIPL